jgi:Fur family ferric uptake transcriptional regulator
MSSAKDTFHQLLKEAGYSLTAARTAVFEALEGQEPLSMHQLVERAGSVDRASVYRAVELFEKLHIVQRLNTGWKYKIELTDKFSAHHHHLTCVTCGQTIAMKEIELEAFIDEIARSHGFTPQAHQIEIQGLCQSCRPKIV